MQLSTCDWCLRSVPVDQLVPVTLTVDKDTGMADEEEFVCDVCIEPWRKQQREDDEGYEPTLEYE